MTIMEPCSPLSFEEFLKALRELEAKGRIKVLKWPTHPDDSLQVKLLRN